MCNPNFKMREVSSVYLIALARGAKVNSFTTVVVLADDNVVK